MHIRAHTLCIYVYIYIYIYIYIYFFFLLFQYAIGLKSIAALKKRYGTQYVTGNIAETICKYRVKLILLTALD